MRRFSLSLLAIAFCLAGCRDALVDEPPGGVDTPPPSETQDIAVRGIYVKGSPALDVGGTASYRAESLPDAIRYVWVQTPGSTGTVSGTPTDSRDRLYDLTGGSPGVVTLRVSALDAQSREIGVGHLTLRVDA